MSDKTIPIIKTATTGIITVEDMVSKYLHQLFCPDSALYRNGIFEILMPPN